MKPASGLPAPTGAGTRLLTPVRGQPDLHEKAEHVGLRVAHGDALAGEMQDGDSGQRDGVSGSRDTHEIVHVRTGQGEADDAGGAVPEDLVEFELRSVEGPEDALS